MNGDRMMMELILNLTWVAIALVSSAHAIRHRRDARTFAAVAIVLALLFPIISPSDDLANISGSIDVVAILMASILFLIALVPLARLIAEAHHFQAITLVPSGDPRSPPRA